MQRDADPAPQSPAGVPDERLFATLVAHFSDAVSLLRPDGSAIYVTPAITTILGYQPEEFIGVNIFTLIHPDDGERVQTLFAEILHEPRASRAGEFRARHSDGSWRWIEGTGTNLLQEPSVSAIVANFRDTAERHRGQDDLRRSRDQLAAIFRSASDGITVQDENGRTLFANDRAAHLVGLDTAGLLSMSNAELMSRLEIFDENGNPFPPQQMPGRRVLAGENVPELTLQFRVRDTGQDIWVVVKSTPVDNIVRRGRMVLNVFHDITERKRAEDLRRFLTDASDLLTSSLDRDAILATLTRLAVPDFADVCLVDMVQDDGGFARVAVACADPEHEAATRQLLDSSPGTNRRNPVEQVLATGGPLLEADLRPERLLQIARSPEHLAAMQAVGPRSLICAPLRARGRILGALTMVQAWSGRRYTAADLTTILDLTRRAALAADNAGLFHAVQEERNRLQQVLAVLPEAIVTVDAAGRPTAENAAAGEFVGPEPDMAAASGNSTVLHAQRPDGTPLALHELPLLRSLRQGETVRGEQLTIRRPRDGVEVPLLVNSAPLRDAAGSINGSVASFQDISAIYEFERARDEFIASASHDLRTPLTAIQGFTQLLQRRAARGRRDLGLQDALDGIDRAAARMGSLVRELLDVARLQMGQPLELDRRPTDLVKLARQEAASRHELNPRHELLVESEVESLVGQWDGPRLERVLSNLIGNAVKYSPAGSCVVIRVKRDAGNGVPAAVLEVSDEGAGIPAADLPHVFDRFYRGRNAGGRIEGMGLGLATVREIVAQHGGTVAVSSAPSAGTTFTVRLPLSAA